jgi:hypothetical protein
LSKYGDLSFFPLKTWELWAIFPLKKSFVGFAVPPSHPLPFFFCHLEVVKNWDLLSKYDDFSFFPPLCMATLGPFSKKKILCKIHTTLLLFFFCWEVVKICQNISPLRLTVPRLVDDGSPNATTDQCFYVCVFKTISKVTKVAEHILPKTSQFTSLKKCFNSQLFRP